MLLILSINIVLLPVAVSFFQDFVDPRWLAFTVLSDIIFITDIVLNFWTGIVSTNNTVILELKLIRNIYVKKWFAFDILSVFPFDYITFGILTTQSVNATILKASTALRLLRLLKLLSFLRLFRVVKFVHYLGKWEEVRC